jgi:hypothetical protein
MSVPVELVGVVQEFVRALTPVPSGRPREISRALGKSVYISFIAARNLSVLRFISFTAIVATIVFTVSLSREILNASSLNAENIGQIPATMLTIVYSLALLLMARPVLRKMLVYPYL